PDAMEPGCSDGDGDGFGEGCSRGPDCDDTDSFQTGVELCGDGRDNDCDGERDETGDGADACLCDPTCLHDPGGPGTMRPFDTTDGSPDESDGVGTTPEGWIRLDTTMINTRIIWVANTQEGTVSKVDTTTFVELGRYRTGPAGGGDYFSGEDPSRTSVNTFSDVFVGNRAGQSLTKISALADECPDTNGDGMITTSHGPTEILPWGMDDCVLWRTELTGGGIIRSVAAQDVEGPDFELIPYVWVGGWNDTVWKLDGTTGAILLRTESPVHPYGFALDGNGNLWISGRDHPALGRIDTTRCTDDACGGMTCGDDGDACVKQRISAPSNTYGITVDREQRVWLGGDDRVMRYEHGAAMGARWASVSPGVFIHGITADALGFVYGAGQGSGIYRFDANVPTMFLAIPGTMGLSAKGMAVDFDGKV
ncbi:MAG: Uncharacterized protein FD127_4211, partial [Acidimicrobiaceae bacterium]